MNLTFRWQTSVLALLLICVTGPAGDAGMWQPRPTTSELRQAWIEQRHRAAPDVDWRQQDANYRALLNKKKTPLPHVKAAALLSNGRDGVWQELGSTNQAGRVVLAKLDPVDNTVWALADGGQLWTRPLEGVAWSVVSDSHRLHRQDDIAFAMTNGQRRLIRAGPALGADTQYSDDAGVTWIAGASQSSPYQIHMSLVSTDHDSDELYRVVRRWDPGPNVEYMDVYRSVNAGLTFELVDTTAGHLATLFSPAEASTAYALIDHQLFSVSASGLTLLSEVDQSLGNDLIHFLSLSGGSDYLYALIITDGNKAVYRSTNGGLSFDYRGEVPEPPFMHNSFAASIQNPDIVYVGGINGHVSLDGGLSWQLISEWYEYYSRPADRLHADIPDFSPVLTSSGEEILLIGTDGGLYTSDPLVSAVENISLTSLNVSQYYDTLSASYDTEILFVGAQDQGLQRTLSATESPWFEQIIAGDYSSLASGDGGQSLWSVYVNFAHYSAAAAATPMELSRWDYDFSGALFLAPLVVHATDPTKAWLGGGGFNGQHFIHQLSWQANSGISATSFNHDFGSAITSIATDPHHANHLFVSNDNALFVSEDGGLSWSQSTFPQGDYFFPTKIVVDPFDQQRLLVSGSGYSAPGVYESLNHGQTLHPMTEGLPDTLVSDLAFSHDGTLLLAATDLGPFAYDLDNERWYDIRQSAAPDQNYTSVEWVAELNAARFATYGRGVWQMTELDGEGTVLGEQASRGDRSGNAIAVGPNTAISGAWFSKVNGVRSGAAYVHVRSVFGTWNQTERLLPPQPETAMRFGTSVALCPDQTIAIVGSPGEANKDGGAYVYKKDVEHWELTDQIYNPDQQMGTEFGIAVGCTGRQLIVGARRHKSGSRNTGAAFVYDLTPDGESSFSDVLFHGDPGHGDRFGSTIAVDGDNVIIGAPLLDDDGKSNSGAAYVFTFDGGAWSQVAKLTAPSIRAGDEFGAAVAINADIAAVGAPLRNVNMVSNNGAAFVFKQVDGVWSDHGELSSAQLNAGDKLGFAVAISDNNIVVGAPFHDANKPNAGAVLSFQLIGEQWAERWLRQMPTPQKGERLGVSLATTGPRVFAGAEQRESNDKRAGIVYVMRDDNPDY
ncbi:MAG: hypothetical protein DHS20C11_00140 [Lysobacteraceae bacterium]|nr:MAG: hypothetical protein DHS20C11_00140 [Xanthomonadaceae bacterium]